MGCTMATGSKEERTTTTTVMAKRSPPSIVERRFSASQAESTGEAEKASSATTLSSQLADSLTIVHFNDVYNIEEREKKEPCGGAPRFKTQVDSLGELDPLVFFSGDALNPSNSKCHLARWSLRPFTEIVRGRKLYLNIVVYTTTIIFAYFNMLCISVLLQSA